MSNFKKRMPKPRSSLKVKNIILGMFDTRQHNRQYMRLCYKYLPGTPLKDYTNLMAFLHLGDIYEEVEDVDDLLESLQNKKLELNEKEAIQLVRENNWDIIRNAIYFNFIEIDFAIYLIAEYGDINFIHILFDEFDLYMDKKDLYNIVDILSRRNYTNYKY